MSTRKQLLLLRDLVELLLNYGPQTFTELANSLLTSDMAQDLSHILSQIAKTDSTPASPKVKVTTIRPLMPRALIALQTSDPQKYQAILELYQDLTAKLILPSLRNIKEFAADQGLAEIDTRARREAIAKLITALISLSNDRVTMIIERARRQKDSDRTLDSWSKLILKQQDRG